MFYKREPIFDMFPSTSVDMFPITIGVENILLLQRRAEENVARSAILAHLI